MVDVSAYIEAEYPEGEDPAGQAPAELSEEDKQRLFFDFEKIPQLQARFKGAGQTYNYKGNEVKTWHFIDINGLTWLLPQWAVLSEPQPPFKGFQDEPADEFLYYIIYNGKKEFEGGYNKFDFSIYRKKA